MTTLYIATRYVTFIGALLRTFWEQLACRICLVPIEEVRPLRADELCGHVEHELTKKLSKTFFVCWFPFTMNFLIGCSFLLTGAYRLFYIGETSLQACGLVWLAVSLLANCTCSFEDALSFKDYLYSKDTSLFVKILLTPHFAVSYAAAFLERYSVTFVLAILFAWVFPTLFSFTFPLINQILN